MDSLTPQERDALIDRIVDWRKANPSVPASGLPAEIRKAMDAIGDISPFWYYTGPDEVVSIQDIREQIANQRPVFRFFTGIQGLDECINGIETGEMIVVSGKTKNGKSLLCQTITTNLVEQGILSLWFSYEIPYRQFANQIPNGILLYMPKILATNALTWIEDRISEGIQKFCCRTIFIDHLHYLVDMARLRNPSLEIGSIVRALKRMAIKHDIVIFLVSHISKVLPGQEITEDFVRDSGFTAAEADSTWIVSRQFDKDTKEATNLAKLSVRNHRRAGVMGKTIWLVKNGPFFEECPKEVPNANLDPE